MEVVKIEEHHKEHETKSDKKEETVTLTKTALWKGLSGLLGVLLVLSIFTGGFGVGGDSPSSVGTFPSPIKAAPNAPSPNGAAVADMKALADDDPFLGSEDAPVTIIEWSDYECPFCAKFYSQTLDQIKSQYVETGKVKFVYRDFPLSFHPQAEPAAIAANCAGEQGKYFEFHNKIFDNGGATGKSSIDYKKWVQEFGLDVATWEQCLNDPAQKAEIAKDIQDGVSAGIQGTPGFLINGNLVSGAQPFSVFQQVIEAELN